MLAFGKPDQDFLAGTIFHDSGLLRDSVISGPRPGVDVGVARIDRKRGLIGSSDPLSYIPELGPLKSGFLSVNSIASDIATSGFPPQYAFFVLNLPRSMSNLQLASYWRAIQRSCLELGISIVGGHTGRFEGIDYTVVGAGTMLAIVPTDRYVTSAMARAGDDLILTKSVALEAAAVLASVFPKTVAKKVGTRTAARAKALWRRVSTVKDALVAASVGLRTSVTAMHDVTEGGVFSAAMDIADASNLKLKIETANIQVFDEVREVCKAFEIDPYTSLGQGGLLICSRPHSTDTVLHAFDKAKTSGASVIGKLSSRGRNILVDKNGKTRKLSRRKTDPYWGAYWKAHRKRLE